MKERKKEWKKKEKDLLAHRGVSFGNVFTLWYVRDVSRKYSLNIAANDSAHNHVCKHARLCRHKRSSSGRGASICFSLKLPIKFVKTNFSPQHDTLTLFRSIYYVFILEEY